VKDTTQVKTVTA